MAKTPPAQPGLFAAAPFAFADRFLQDHAGTFNLQKRLLETQPAVASDPEVEEVRRVNAQQKLFDDAVPKAYISAPNGKDKSSAETVQTEGKS